MFRWAGYAAMTVAAALALSACGGGDSEEPVTSAEGIWTGNSPVGDSKGLDASLLVLENGETWAVIGLATPVDTLHGAMISADGKLSGSNTDGTGGSYSGTYAPRASMEARLGFTNFTGSYASTYDQPASLAAFTGSHWATGKAVFPAEWLVTISDSSTLRIVPALGCEGSGSLKPRASGKNVFDLGVSFSGEGCASLGLGWGDSPRMSGVVWQDGTRLIVMGLKPDPEPVSQRRSGFAFTVTPSQTPPPPTPVPPAEPLANPIGVWTGTLSTGRALTLLVLEDGDTWGFYRRPDGSLVTDSVLHGATSWADGKLSGLGEEARILSGSYGGTYTPSGSMQMQFQEGTFSGSYSGTHDQPASLAAIAGRYEGLDISDSGDYRYTLGTSGCFGSGKATPRASGKNVFDVSVHRTCWGFDVISSDQGSGVMYYENGTLTIMALMPEGTTRGLVFQGARTDQ